MSGHLRAVFVIGDVNGGVDALERVLDEAADEPAGAVALVGDIAAPWGSDRGYRRLFEALGRSEQPAFWVPGPADAPIRDFLFESYNIEVVFSHLRGVHGTAALGPEHTLFAGMGGEIGDDPDVIRAEEAVLRYPAWEAEFRLKIVTEFKDYPSAFLFSTRPAHKGLHEPGSEVLAELINTYQPRLAVFAGKQPREERLGKTLLVCPGRLADGNYAVVDFHELTVEQRNVGAHAPA